MGVPCETSVNSIPNPTPTPSWDDIHQALIWALEHDLPALVEHRAAVHLSPYGWSRRDADELLVARWRQAAAGAEPQPCGSGATERA
jgi:hypothetical protein